MISDVVVLPQIPESIDPSVRADHGAVLQSLLLAKLAVVGLVAKKSLRTLVGLYMVLAAARRSPIGA